MPDPADSVRGARFSAHGSPRSLALLAAILFVPAVSSAQSLPPAAPTTAAATPQTVPAPVTRSLSSPTRARVQVRNGLATVVADNSSLNQILRELADRSGMTITGGVADERVFGSYGPADVTTILNMLLEGTGSNILLLESANNRPRQLVLTPRGGGPSPPSPPTINRDDDHNREDDDTPPQQVRNVDRRLAPQPAIPPQAAPAAVVTPTSAPPAAAADTTQQSPNGVKTPQQIYEQLMKMQQTPATAPK